MTNVSKPAYRIKSVILLTSGAGTLVREFTFAPGESTPWHRHSAVDDRCYVLEGSVSVETRAPAARADLVAGDGHFVPAGSLHRIVNRGEADARLVLVQHGGRYDFVAEPVDALERKEP